MKKILSILFAGVIALMATSCMPDENFATFDPSKATAPVVGAYEMSTKALTVEYTPGRFNMGFNDKMPVNHMLVLTSVDGKAVNKVIATTNKDNVLTASVSALSNALVALGYKEDDSVNFEALVRATMQNPPQDNGFGAAAAGAGMGPNGNFDNGGSMIIDSKMNEDQNLGPDDDAPF